MRSRALSPVIALLLATMRDPEPDPPRPVDPVPPRLPEVAAIDEVCRAEHARCMVEKVKPADACVRIAAAGQAVLDQRWPGVFEIEADIDDDYRFAAMVRRRDRPTYPFVPAPAPDVAEDAG